MKRRIIFITGLLLLTINLFSEDYWFWQKKERFAKQNYEYYEECYIQKSLMSKEDFFDICEENFEEAVYDNFMKDVSQKWTVIYTSQGIFTIAFDNVNGDAQQVSVIFSEYGGNTERLYRNIYVDSYEVALQDYNSKCKKYKNKLNE